MTTMLERAARALYEMGRPAVATSEHWNLEWPDLGKYSHEKYRKQARAVLMSVREPEDAMNNAGSSDGWDCMGPSETFTAMIDAILNEEG